jgi:hypothetical protein
VRGKGTEHTGAAIVRSEEALIGMRVQVDEYHQRSDLRGMVGMITKRWGAPDYLALDVLLDDGSSVLFWHHELEEVR